MAMIHHHLVQLKMESVAMDVLRRGYFPFIKNEEFNQEFIDEVYNQVNSYITKKNIRRDEYSIRNILSYIFFIVGYRGLDINFNILPEVEKFFDDAVSKSEKKSLRLVTTLLHKYEFFHDMDFDKEVHIMYVNVKNKIDSESIGVSPVHTLYNYGSHSMCIFSERSDMDMVRICYDGCIEFENMTDIINLVKVFSKIFKMLAE